MLGICFSISKNSEMAKRKLLDPDSVCRICLKEKLDLFLIFDESFTTSDTPTAAEIISQLTRYKVERFDDLPHQICGDCLKWSQEAYRFCHTAEKSYRKLIDLVGVTEVSLNESQVNVEVQTENFNFSCSKCNKECENILELQKHHLFYHQKRRQIIKNQCDQCEKKFALIKDLRNHMMEAHEEKDLNFDQNLEFSCNYCKKVFNRKYHLKRHLHSVHKVDPEGMNLEDSQREGEEGIENIFTVNKTQNLDKKCVLCDREFRRKEHLKRHLLIVHKQAKISKNLMKPISKNSEPLPEPQNLWECIKSDGDEDFNNDMDPVNPFSSNEEDSNDADSPDKILEEPLFDPSTLIKSENISISEDFGSPNESLGKENTLLENTFSKIEYIDTEALCKKEFLIEELDNIAEEPTEKEFQQNESFPKAKKPRAKRLKKLEVKCEHCEKVFHRHYHLRRHLLSHMDEKPHECPHCDKRFARSDHLKNHIAAIHKEKQFKCDKCEMAFSKEDVLQRHKDVKHNEGGSTEAVRKNLKTHQCATCLKRFSSKSYLQKHSLLHTDQLFACKHCDETFDDRKKCRQHERSHTESLRKYLCNICGDSFVRADYLRVHMRRHNGEKPYKCQYCDKGFPRATDLKMHERYHTNTKPNSCPICGKAFHRNYTLTIHMRTHTGERPYKCDQCPKTFTQSNDLKAHMRRHTGERFKCSQCDAAFLQMYALRQHSFNAHGIKMTPSTGRINKSFKNLPVVTNNRGPPKTLETPVIIDSVVLAKENLPTPNSGNFFSSQNPSENQVPSGNHLLTLSFPSNALENLASNYVETKTLINT